jgi:uncharacterized LabA/DUF88 family protein
MALDEVLIFVDGENLVLRYQEMLKAGRVPASGNVHIPDSFIWNQRVLEDHMWNLRRVSYYTSVVGDDAKLRETQERIAATSFLCRTGFVAGIGAGYTTRTGQIIPFVRKKAIKSRKESVCDIAIAVDVMRACYRDHAKTIWVFSGDGDFVSLFNEIVHSGKVAYASAFSSGLNEELRYAVDEFLSLDKYFFAEDSSAQTSLPGVASTTKGDA